MKVHILGHQSRDCSQACWVTGTVATPQPCALCTVDSSDEEPFVPVMSNSGENPTAPAQLIPTWIDMTQGDDQSANPNQVEERHMRRGQHEAASCVEEFCRPPPV